MSAQAAAVELVTAQQLWEMPPGCERRELVDGELRTMAPTGFDHGRVAATVGALLWAHARERATGVVLGAETGFRLARDPDTVRAPDAAFVATDRVPTGGEPRFAEMAPDLAVEVVSPSDRAGEVTEKALMWLAAGTELVWVIYPAQRLVAVYTRDKAAKHVLEGETLTGDPVLPHFTVDVAELFR